jgi:DNA-binding NarL/FixJ family response regulator
MMSLPHSLLPRVLVIDDHPLMAKGLQWLFLSQSRKLDISSTHCLGAALEILLIADSAPALILLDLTMPGYEGLEALVELKSKYPDIKVAIFSAHDEPELIANAIRSGACGFIPKSTAPEVVADAIYLMLDGGSFLPPAQFSATEQTPRNLDANRNLSTYDQTPDWKAHARNLILAMPSKRRDVFNFLVQGVSNKEICRELDMSINTVKTHVSLILATFDVHSRQKLAALFQFGELTEELTEFTD